MLLVLSVVLMFCFTSLPLPPLVQPKPGALSQVRSGRWSAIYFVAYMLFCATMMLDVLIGVVIEGFRVSTRGPQQASADPVHLAASDSGGEGTNSGRPSGDDEASLSGEEILSLLDGEG